MNIILKRQLHSSDRPNVPIVSWKPKENVAAKGSDGHRVHFLTISYREYYKTSEIWHILYKFYKNSTKNEIPLAKILYIECGLQYP